ncbi:MAG: DUF445 domain-containing protein [Pseudomonadota bacterium]
MTPSEPDLDPVKAERLRKTRRLAEIVLVALAGVYLATFLVTDPPGWVRLVRHMAEAGMIGALADWFAVVALFRHPFGIRIPHTALLPRNQAKAAESVGQFFKSYFLDPTAITARVAELAPARRAAEWLSEGKNARLVAAPLTQALSVALKSGDEVTLPPGLRREIRAALDSEAATEGLTQALGPMLKGALSGSLLSDTLAQLRTSLDRNRERVLEIVQDKSRWWVASRVDRGVSNTLVDGVMDVLEDVETGEGTVREDVQGGLTGLIDRLASSGALARAVHEGKASFLASPAFDALLEDLLEALRGKLSEGLSRDPGEAEAAIAEAIEGFARKLLSHEATLARFETQLETTAQTAIVELRDPIAGYVEEVIASWDAETLSARFEQEIGPDLQFIRINGSVLGALIGGLFFFLGMGLTALGS